MVILCKMNVLSLISQRLDNYYQIQTKYYSVYGISGAAPEGKVPGKTTDTRAPRNSSEIDLQPRRCCAHAHAEGGWDAWIAMMARRTNVISVLSHIREKRTELAIQRT